MLTGEAAHAEPLVITAGVGVIRLEKRTPVELSATSALARVEGGIRLGPRSAARLRLEGFRADGVNLFAALVVDLDLTDHLGVIGFAGISIGERSGFGNNFGVGGFGRYFVRPTFALRVDLFLSVALRNDFGGVGAGAVVGVEYRP